MSNSIETIPTPISEFQSFVGTPPGTHDAKAECKEWERVCAGLIAERQQLCGELAKTKKERDAYLAAWIKLKCKDDILQLTNEEILSCVGREPPLRDLIAGLDLGPGN